ncbi:MAG: ATP-binding protein [Acidobacteriota bacterium]|nr:ATP-binding protein [Acidobacteriota bacterium]
MRPEFQDAQVTFEVQSWDGPLRVPYDARLIRRVLLNLLENARRFTAAGGMVTISVAPEFWERRNQKFRQAFSHGSNKPMAPNCVKIVVADTGCGMDALELQRIFDDGGSNEEAGPTGRSLVVSRKIVMAHGGKIWVESKTGEGSRFCFYLPFVAPTEGVFLDEGEEL